MADGGGEGGVGLLGGGGGGEERTPLNEMGSGCWSNRAEGRRTEACAQQVALGETQRRTEDATCTETDQDRKDCIFLTRTERQTKTESGDRLRQGPTDKSRQNDRPRRED